MIYYLLFLRYIEEIWVKNQSIITDILCESDYKTIYKFIKQ